MYYRSLFTLSLPTYFKQQKKRGLTADSWVDPDISDLFYITNVKSSPKRKFFSVAINPQLSLFLIKKCCLAVEANLPGLENLLRAADKKDSPRPQRLGKTPIKRGLCLFRKIDHHITAQNQITMGWELITQQILPLPG
jgi:hypothetical protein